MKLRALHLLLFLISLLTGCAGYHFNTNNNPLIGYDIHSVAVPMFINRTNIVGLKSIMTKEIILSLNDFSGLKIYGGDYENADAVLIGILESDDLYNKTFTTAEQLSTEGDKNISTSIGSRSPFLYAVKTSYNFKLRLILIKRPSKMELELLTNEVGKVIKSHPKIVLQEELPVSGSFTRAVSDNLTATSGGSVNFTKNRGFLTKSLQETCIQTANSFKQVVLNAF